MTGLFLNGHTSVLLKIIFTPTSQNIRLPLTLIMSSPVNASAATQSPPPRRPKCARCRHHGLMVRLKGHARKCPFSACTCLKCNLVTQRTKITAVHRNTDTNKATRSTPDLKLRAPPSPEALMEAHGVDEEGSTVPVRDRPVHVADFRNRYLYSGDGVMNLSTTRRLGCFLLVDYPHCICIGLLCYICLC